MARNARNDELQTPTARRIDGDMAPFMGTMSVNIGKDQDVSFGTVPQPTTTKETPTTGPTGVKD